MSNPKRCGRCKKKFEHLRAHGNNWSGLIGTGYARLASKPKGARDAYICYACCAEDDKTTMRLTSSANFYLKFAYNPRLAQGLQGTVGAHEARMLQYSITNWPGTLTFVPTNVSLGKHNIARTRTDVWFIFEGYFWHGVMYGNNGELLRCKQTSQRVPAARWAA